jgi:hypothetical protein
LIKHGIRALAFDTDFWFDNHWILDSTPVECGRSRPTVQRCDAAGWAAYGYCAWHSRFFLGPAPVADLHPDRDADPVGAGRGEDRRTYRRT